MSFVFRLRTRIRCRLSAAFPAILDVEGFPPIEVSYETENQNCLVDEQTACPSATGAKFDGGRYTFIGRGFATEDAALVSGRTFADLMLAAGATKHMGVDVGFDRESLHFAASVHDAVRKATGQELRGDKIGLMTYRQDSVQILRIEAALSTQMPLATFLSELSSIARPASSITERQRTCAALLNDSQFAVQDEATFVLLISAVEALCDQSDLPAEYVKVVEDLETCLAGIRIDDDGIREVVQSNLKFAKKRSIRQSILSKCRALLGDKAARELDELYNLRSKFVHDGQGRGELRGRIGRARELGAALFEADLRSQSSAQDVSDS